MDTVEIVMEKGNRRLETGVLRGKENKRKREKNNILIPNYFINSITNYF
jgi:hypothetical protein